MKKITVGLICGGKNGEHEVSLLSAKSIYAALDKSKYNVLVIAIDKKGNWIFPKQDNLFSNSQDANLISLNNSDSSSIIPISNTVKSQSIDVFFPIIHGTYGEDGSLQGLLEILDGAFVGSGVLGSAIGMDKDITKRLLKESGIPITPFISLKKHESESKIDKFINSHHFPLFVKPANMGSSVGISKVHDKSELLKAIKIAFKYDAKIIIEEGVRGHEIECSILGNEHPTASELGEIVPHDEFYSYKAKYIDENGAELIIPAKIERTLKKKIQNMAIKVFEILECKGMARVDFFLTDDGEIFLNEINTIPGFTSISMYPKLWEASGISYSVLLDKLINLAIELKKEKDTILHSYNNGV